MQPIDIRCTYVRASFGLGRAAAVASIQACRQYSTSHLGERISAFFADVHELANAWQYEQDLAACESVIAPAETLFSAMRHATRLDYQGWVIIRDDGDGAPHLWLTNPHGIDVGFYPFTIAACGNIFDFMFNEDTQENLL